ncbi:HAD domain-containing protein [Anaerostipes sp.]|uniref:HAD domain-containing protein n=1 Tax=Anaerostipes sp. TaxID=1872530 RepID=UPI0025BEA790|nr:HAD domain-containing protein [Anaerostipes sp.]MBS7006970.1 hypothetical protein [Anaerostipes sp.]
MAFTKRWFRRKPDKIIFLDIDGVLNSMDLFDKMEERKTEPFMGIAVDEENLEQLKYIVEQTGAKIVLSSSWRHAWHEKGPMIKIGRSLDQAMAVYGMKIISKTKHLHKGNRSLEVKDWMRGKHIQSFVILDDTDYDWIEYGLGDHWVRTDFMEGGLNRTLAQRAVNILNQ